MIMILIKAIVSAVMILFLVYVTERNPKIGGIIAGLPGATAVMIFFFTKEHGIEFTLNGLPYAIAGLSSSLFYAIGFYIGGYLYTGNRRIQSVIASLLGLSSFLISSIYITSIENITLTKSILIFIISVSIAIAFFNNISKKKVNLKKRTLSEIIILFSFVVIFIVLITEYAKILGPRWAGVMASFPTGPAPLLVILLLNYGNDIYPFMLKNLTRSITTVVIFYLLLICLLPLLGLNLGFFISYLICLIYLYSISKIEI